MDEYMAMAGRPDEVPVRTTILGRSLFDDSHVAAPCSAMIKKRSFLMLQAPSGIIDISDSLVRPSATSRASSLAHVKVEPSDETATVGTFASLRSSSAFIDISDSPVRAPMSIPSTVGVPVKVEPVEPEPSLDGALETLIEEEMDHEDASGLPDSVEADEEAGKELHEDEA